MNTFHAFVKKAKTTSDQFAKIIEDVTRTELCEETEPEPESDLKAGSISMTEVEFDVDPEETVATNDHSLGVELDLIVNKENDDSIGLYEMDNDSE